MSRHPRPEMLPYRPGVGLVLYNEQGLVFAASRIDSPGAWQLPQGGIDEGETPEQAVMREMEEEIGTKKAVIIAAMPDWLSYDLPAELVGKVWKGRYRGQRQKWFALRFTGTDADIDIHTRHPEFDAWRWMDLDDLAARIVPFKAALYRRLAEEFRPVGRTLGR